MVNNDPTSDIGAVAKVGQVLGLFGPRSLELTANEVAEKTGMNRTTAYRYCSSMTVAGILEKGSRRGLFTLGPLMLELGALTLGRQRVVEIARPWLRQLSTDVRLTAVLSLAGTDAPVVSLVEEDTSRMVVVTVHPGTRLDHTAAQTHLWLAYSKVLKLDQIATAQKLTAAERARLEADVLTAREQRYAFVRQPGGSFTLGAPVFDETGLCATIGVLGAGDLTETTGVLAELQKTAHGLSQELGAPDDPATQV